jgi:DNA-binding NtrC family response regulator
MPSILCIEDDSRTASALEHALSGLGYASTLVSSVEDGMRALSGQAHDLVIFDLALPDAGGLERITLLRERAHDAPIIVAADYGNVEEAVRSIKLGAADYLTKPVRAESLRLAIKNAIEMNRLKQENDAARRELGALMGTRRIVGQSPPIQGVLEVIRSVANTRSTVLVHGESGTGKELLARAMHEQSSRRGMPFVTVNCAALPDGLVETTLFGHERGSFTGASARALGAFERAHRGTLLLDEVSEMRLDVQAKLLRAIQEQEFERVGGAQPIQVDVRIIATSNRDLESEVAAGRFRRDLFYRINVVPIHAPPLREHLEDLPQLVEHFMALYANRIGVRPPSVPANAIEVLRSHSWPGNVRELANVVERAVIHIRTGQSMIRSFRDSVGCRPVRSPVGVIPDNTVDLQVLERSAIQRALRLTGGNRTRAARMLGISERTLRNRLNTSPS